MKQKSVCRYQPSLLIHVLPCLIALCFALLTASATVAQPQDYYVDDGRSVSRVVGQDPAQVKVEEWHVRLYKAGQPTSGRGHWGLITGKSAASVMKQLKDSQAFELRYNRWAGKGSVPDEVDTHFNPLGPIAVIRPPKPAPARYLEQASGLVERIQESRGLISDIEDILSKAPKDANPFENVGQVLKEYVENLQDAQERVRELEKMLHDGLTPALNAIDTALQDINRDLATVDRHRPTLSSAVLKAQGPRGAVPPGSLVVTAQTAEGAVEANDRFDVEIKDGVLTYTQAVKRIYAGRSRRIEEDRTSHCRLADLDATAMRIGKIQPLEGVTAWRLTIPTKNRSKAVVIDRLQVRENGQVTEPYELFDEDYQALRLVYATEQEARTAMEALRTAIAAVQ